ncbi:ABC transporter permease [Ectopseudomonas alcaliphila]|uniref:ABC transporter permease n=1 Tax=Ectopseudomonas alcaliphila TaxID=101564 RepID=UPI00277E448A|nr:putative spermidine/putrescine transport system permease protein [Pseudomonas sp. 3400]MDR7012191.1 putative spermidine/putrescine transport system permease protein [Pseudomonas alcaliphila]
MKIAAVQLTQSPAGGTPRSARLARWKGSLPLLPALLFLSLFFLAPLIGLLLRGILEPEPGLGNYETLFANSAYARVLFNTFAVAGLVTLISLLLGFPLAWAITLAPRGWGRWLLSIVLLSMWTSLLARTYSWLVLLQASGVINKSLMAVGLIDQPLEMVHNLTGVVIGMSYIMIPFIVLPLQATMSAIDPMVLQAGSICGASPWRNFFRVFLPLCRPGLFSGGLMVFVMSLGYYVTPALLGGAQNMMLPEFIVQQVQSFLNWGLASAAAALLIAITLLLFYAYLKLQPESPVASSTAR